MERICIACGELLHPTKRRHAKYCSVGCGNTSRGRVFYARHPETILEKRRRENSNTKQRIFYRVKSRAKRNGIDFTIDEADIKVPETCPILGMVLDVLPGKGSGYHPTSPSLDRINPAYGYVKGNVRVISARANLLKNNATSAELKLVLADLLENNL